MTELIDFFSRHELLGWYILILFIAVHEIKQSIRKVGNQLSYTNRYLLLLVERQYSTKEIHQETEDLREEFGGAKYKSWQKLFK